MESEVGKGEGSEGRGDREKVDIDMVVRIPSTLGIKKWSNNSDSSLQRS